MAVSLNILWSGVAAPSAPDPDPVTCALSLIPRTCSRNPLKQDYAQYGTMPSSRTAVGRMGQTQGNSHAPRAQVRATLGSPARVAATAWLSPFPRFLIRNWGRRAHEPIGHKASLCWGVYVACAAPRHVGSPAPPSLPRPLPPPSRWAVCWWVMTTSCTAPPSPARRWTQPGGTGRV